MRADGQKDDHDVYFNIAAELKHSKELGPRRLTGVFNYQVALVGYCLIMNAELRLRRLSG